MEPFDLLQTLAEVSAAFAGFTAVIAIFRPRERWDERDVVGFIHFLQLSLGVVLLALAPMVLLFFQLSSDTTWRIVNAVLGLYHLYVISWILRKSIRGAAYNSEFHPLILYGFAALGASTALLNLAVAAELFLQLLIPAYLLGLLWLLSMALLNFVQIFLGSIRTTSR